MISIVKTVVVGDKSYQLQRLNIHGIMAVSSEIHAFKEALVKKYCKEADFDKEQTSNALLDLSFRKPTISDIVNSCDVPEVLLSVIKMAAKNSKYTNEEADEIINSQSLSELPMLAKALILDVNLDKKKEDGDAAAPAPVVPPFVPDPSTGKSAEETLKPTFQSA